MNLFSKLKTALIITITLIGVNSCSKNNSAESAGNSIDKAIGNTKKEVKTGTKNVAGYIDDSALTAKIKSVLLSEPGLKSFQIEVETSEGVTTLKGTVDSTKRKDDVEMLVAKVDGVKDVHNALEIRTNK